MSFLKKYSGPGDLPTQFPLFPLRGVVLFPRTTLPLNVFEPRYLKMVDDAISSDRVIGIIQPDDKGTIVDDSAEDQSNFESPAGKSIKLRDIGCLGRISAYHELDDGRVMINLTGLSRFRMSNEVSSDQPYRIANAQFSEYETDFLEGHEEKLVDREHLMRVLKAYFENSDLKADWDMISRASNELLVNVVSLMCPFGPQDKQALLEAPDLVSRAKVLIALAEMELAISGEGGGGTIQ